MSGDGRDEANEDERETAYEDRLIGEELARQRRNLGRRLVIIGAVVFVGNASARLLGVDWVMSLVTVGAVMIFLGFWRLIGSRKTSAAARRHVPEEEGPPASGE